MGAPHEDKLAFPQADTFRDKTDPLSPQQFIGWDGKPVSRPRLPGETMTAATTAIDRRRYLGGSDAAAILGLSPWGTPYTVWEEKTGRATSDADNLATRSGTVLEPLVADLYAEEKGVTLLDGDEHLAHPDHPFIAGHPDRYIKGDPSRIVECKTSTIRKRDAWGQPGSNEIPDHYQVQVQHYLGLCGATHADVAVLFGNEEFAIYEVERNDPVVEMIYEELCRFWNEHVEEGVPPDPVNVEDVRRRWRKETAGKVVEADDQVVAWLREMLAARAAKKQAAEREDAMKAKIQAAMADADSLMFGLDRLASWRHQTSRRLDTKAVRSALGKDIGKFEKVSESRVFRIAPAAEKLCT